MLRERRSQLLEREPSARLHGAERQRCSRGDLALTEPAEVRELDDLALLGRKLLERRRNVTRTLGRLRLLLRIRRGGSGSGYSTGPIGGWHHALEWLFRATPAGALTIERATPRDRRQPGRYGAARGIVPARLSPRLPERLLHGILRLISLPEQIVRERVYGRCPPIVQHAERLLVPGRHARHEGGIRLRVVRHERLWRVRS